MQPLKGVLIQRHFDPATDFKVTNPMYYNQQQAYRERETETYGERETRAFRVRLRWFI